MSPRKATEAEVAEGAAALWKTNRTPLKHPLSLDVG